MTTDAFWCGRLSQGIREALADMPAEALATRNLRRLLDDYEVASGFPPPGAEIISHVGHDMPLDLLKPGERLINGTIYYSSLWLNDDVTARPAIIAEAS